MKLVMTILLVLCSIILVILAIEHAVFLIPATGTALYASFWFESYKLDKRVDIKKAAKCVLNLEINDAINYNKFIEFILNNNLKYAALTYELIKKKENLYIPKVYEKYKNKSKIR